MQSSRITFLVALMAMLYACPASGQKAPPSYAMANPGILTVDLDLRSDSAHLKSYIGPFVAQDVHSLRAFITSDFVQQHRNPPAQHGQHNSQLMDSLAHVLNHPIETCVFLAGDTADCTFHTPLESEVIRPLILLVHQNHYVCQMVVGAKRRD